MRSHTYYTITTRGIANLNVYRLHNNMWTVCLQYGFRDRELLYPPITARSYAALIKKIRTTPGFFVRKGSTPISRYERPMLTKLIKESKIFTQG